MSYNFAKNELQEYCQKNKLGLPVYKAELISEGKWTVSATILKDGIVFDGEGIDSKKKEAEKKAANDILKQIKI